MSDEQKSLHISQVGENWEVESEASTLGQAETKPEAIELAKALAGDEGVSQIAVHTSDGQVEQQISVEPPNNPRDLPAT